MEKTIKEAEKLLFGDEAEKDKTPSHRFSDEIRRQVFESRKQSLSRMDSELRKELNEEAKYKQIGDFIRKHVEKVGKEQAVKDVQTGLNLLFKNFDIYIKEDSEYGKETHITMKRAITFYSLRAIKMYIKRGIINNLIFETKNNPYIDTHKEVDNIGKNLIIERRN